MARYTYNDKGHREPYITEEQILQAVRDDEDRGTYEYAKALNETSQIVLRALERAEKRGLVQRRIVCRNMPLWSLTGKKRCVKCDEFLEYTGTEWACPTCEHYKFCTKNFDVMSEECKRCNIAVECYEVSESNKVEQL